MQLGTTGTTMWLCRKTKSGREHQPLPMQGAFHRKVQASPSTRHRTTCPSEEEENAQGVTQSACSTMCTGTQVHCKEDSAATIATTTVLLSPGVAPYGSRRLESRRGATSAQIGRTKLGTCLCG